jgi:hypothetical protein
VGQIAIELRLVSWQNVFFPKRAAMHPLRDVEAVNSHRCGVVNT